MRPKPIARLGGALLAALALGAITAPAATAFELQWYGQSAFRIATDGGRVILIDPFLTANPVTPEPLKDLSALGDVDLVLVTHAHGDHVGDTGAIAAQTGAKVGVNADFGHTLGLLGIVSYDHLIRFNKSGPIRPLGDGITITMTHAEHSSEFVHEDPKLDEKRVFPGGEPAGYIIELEDGFTIYHAGDTGVFTGMRLIAELYEPDLALLPIGGHFTMDPRHAAFAVRELLGVKRVIPMHYGTFPPLKGTPAEFADALGDYDAEVIVMEPGEKLTF